MAGALAALEAAVAALQEQLGQANIRADQAETRADQLRAQIDAQRATIDELRAGQALMTDMHARELAAAQDRLERVRDAAEALRQAEADRQARGLVARLRAALRGE